MAASHLLIKHQGSRRPASWKDESGAEITKRTKEAAREILLKHRQGETRKAQMARDSPCSPDRPPLGHVQTRFFHSLAPDVARDDIMSNASPKDRFAELASVHSDCSSAREKGSLGVFGR